MLWLILIAKQLLLTLVMEPFIFGWIGVLIAAITIASNGFMHNKLEDLGPTVAMMLHPLLYGYFVRLITKVL